eukprot:CAMPEP_0170406430 /NCGR_PEP_ID=MMETSP0117_2-20130122/27711_1 /TAXON_ID=400756 /ORGANISM="Durinskia baltica, Strain CSIRO CS-38" /LENGTH=63 /DNA_ID=CAMNT_0010663613 /DNA_START=216 /DNA_END=403 /DNA_ORIENTATION=-
MPVGAGAGPCASAPRPAEKNADDGRRAKSRMPALGDQDTRTQGRMCQQRIHSPQDKRCKRKLR